MASKSKKRKRSLSPEPTFSDNPPIQKLKIKPMPKIPPDNASSGKKSSKKRKQEVSPIPTSVSPGDWDEDGGLKMKFILSPKKTKVQTSPGSDTIDERASPKGKGKGKKKDKQIKAKLFFADQVLTLDGDTVTHEDMITPGKKRKSGGKQPSPEETPKSKKKKKDADKTKIKEEPMIPPFTKVPKSAERSRIKSIKAESDSGYSDTPTTSGKSKKLKTKLQTVEEQPVPSPQASDVSRDSLPKKKKKEKDKKKKKMFKFKGDRNRFLNVRGSSDEEGDDSFSRSLQDEDSFQGTYDLDDEYESSIKKEKTKEMDRLMMPQMPVPDYNLEKQAAESFAASMRSKSRKDDRNEGEIQSSRAEDLISQLTAFGSDMETIYPSYMLAPEDEKEIDDGGWIKKKKKKKKLAKEKKKKKKKPNIVERDEHGNVKYMMRKTKLSGYMLWCRSYRSTFVSQNPGLDFSTISRRMGALWQTLDEEEKKVWRKREITVNTKVPLKRLNKGKDGASTSSPDAPPFRLKTSSKAKAKKMASSKRKGGMSKKKANTPVKVTPPKWNPIDCAAYLRLLGESLSDVGGKLQTHRVSSISTLHPGTTEDNIEVHGSVSVLLDSMLCSLGPLLCLTDQVPELNALNKKTKTGVLDNIAYIMPGL